MDRAKEWMPDKLVRAPCILDIPDFSGRFSKRDLETAVLGDIEALLLKMRSGSSFVGRQRRMAIDGPRPTHGLFSWHRRLSPAGHGRAEPWQAQKLRTRDRWSFSSTGLEE